MNQQIKFLEDLNALLEKYGAEISCGDHWIGYPECGQDVRITVEFNDYKIPDIDFGGYIDSDKIKQITRAFT